MESRSNSNLYDWILSKENTVSAMPLTMHSRMPFDSNPPN